jgi:hypothetical protein
MNKFFLLLFLPVVFACNEQSGKQTNLTDTLIKEKNSISEIESDSSQTVLEKKENSKNNHPHNLTNRYNNRSILRAESFNFKDFYKQFDPPTQQYSINTSKDTIIICSKGTRIFFRAGSFMTESGKMVTGNIDLRVKEYYSIPDILLCNLTTKSNNEILETGGMLYIEAFSDGEICKLKSDAFIDIAFPSNEKKDDMELFYGEWTNENINWIPADSADLDKIYEKKDIDEEPIFPGGNEKLYDIILKNVDFKESISEGKSGICFITFTVMKDGGVSNVKLVSGIGAKCDTQIVENLKKVSGFIPGKKNGKPVNVNENIFFKLNLTEYSSSDYNIFVDSILNNKNDHYDLNSFNSCHFSHYMYHYIFTSAKLGWINCDRFLKDNRKKVDYVVDIGDNCEYVDAKLVFKNYNSVIDGINSGRKFIFEDLPLDEEIILVVIKYDKGQYYLSFKKTKISPVVEKKLSFVPVTTQTLKNEIDRLIRMVRERES